MPDTAILAQQGLTVGVIPDDQLGGRHGVVIANDVHFNAVLHNTGHLLGLGGALVEVIEAGVGVLEEVTTCGRSDRSTGERDAGERQDEEEKRRLSLRAQAGCDRACDACHKGPGGQARAGRVEAHEEARQRSIMES